MPVKRKTIRLYVDASILYNNVIEKGDSKSYLVIGKDIDDLVLENEWIASMCTMILLRVLFA